MVQTTPRAPEINTWCRRRHVLFVAQLFYVFRCPILVHAAYLYLCKQVQANRGKSQRSMVGEESAIHDGGRVSDSWWGKSQRFMMGGRVSDSASGRALLSRQASQTRPQVGPGRCAFRGVAMQR